MAKTLVPDFVFAHYDDIDADFLHAHGIRVLFCDIDNTLSPYEDAEPDAAVRAWVERMRAGGIALALVSNNCPARVETYNRTLGLVAYADAHKPSRKCYLAAMRALGAKKEDCAVLGDQLLTDCFSARRLGIPCLIVPPIRDKKTWFFRIKRAIEVPFMRAYERKRRKQ